MSRCGGGGQGEAEGPLSGRAVRTNTEASSQGGAEHSRRSFIRSFIYAAVPTRCQTPAGCWAAYTALNKIDKTPYPGGTLRMGGRQ